MPLYQYTAVDEAGRTLRGQMEASDEAVLAAILNRDGQWLAQARERTLSVRQAAHLYGNRFVPRRVLIEFFLQMNLQLKSGVPLFNALSFGLEETDHAGMRVVQRAVLQAVQGGKSFSEALAAHPRAFPPLVVNVIHAGESSGRLAEACGELRRYYEWMDRIIADARQALIYPAIVLSATMIFFFVMFTTLVPKFAAVLGELKIRLPLLTRLLLDSSQVFRQYAWAFGGAVAVVIAGLKWGPKWSARFARALDAAKLRLPVFGPILHLVCQARLAQNLATLYGSGITLLEALKLCKPLAGNLVIEESVADLATSVNAGRPMHEAMRQNRLFTPLVSQMVAVGESSGTLSESLQHVADYYNDLVPRKVKKFLTILEPAMILGLVVLAGIVALAVFLPIAEALGAT
jgi:type IV pilus assembly protein PilC